MGFRTIASLKKMQIFLTQPKKNIALNLNLIPEILSYLMRNSGARTQLVHFFCINIMNECYQYCLQNGNESYLQLSLIMQPDTIYVILSTYVYFVARSEYDESKK